MTNVGDKVILAPLANGQAMSWSLIEATGDSPFMPEGREQPEMPADCTVFED